MFGKISRELIRLEKEQQVNGRSEDSLSTTGCSKDQRTREDQTRRRTAETRTRKIRRNNKSPEKRERKSLRDEKSWLSSIKRTSTFGNSLLLFTNTFV